MLATIILVYGLIVRALDLGKFPFLSHAASLCISRWEWGKGVDLRALALHYPFFRAIFSREIRFLSISTPNYNARHFKQELIDRNFFLYQMILGSFHLDIHDLCKA